MFSLVGKTKLTGTLTCAFTHKWTYSANLEKSSTISVGSRRSVRSSCALERHFPPPEERMRPPLPASCEPGLTSAAPCQLTHAVYLAPWLQGFRSSLAAAALWRQQGTRGDTASKAPLLPWHSPTTQAAAWDGNYSLPTHQKYTLYMYRLTSGKYMGNPGETFPWEGGGKLPITSSFPKVFKVLPKTVCIWKYFISNGNYGDHWVEGSKLLHLLNSFERTEWKVSSIRSLILKMIYGLPRPAALGLQWDTALSVSELCLHAELAFRHF